MFHLEIKAVAVRSFNEALMIGKAPRAVAMKYDRPTTPKTANTAKDIDGGLMSWSICS
jgi:hypothetical protein